MVLTLAPGPAFAYTQGDFKQVQSTLYSLMRKASTSTKARAEEVTIQATQIGAWGDIADSVIGVSGNVSQSISSGTSGISTSSSNSQSASLGLSASFSLSQIYQFKSSELQMQMARAEKKAHQMTYAGEVASEFLAYESQKRLIERYDYFDRLIRAMATKEITPGLSDIGRLGLSRFAAQAFPPLMSAAQNRLKKARNLILYYSPKFSDPRPLVYIPGEEPRAGYLDMAAEAPARFAKINSELGDQIGQFANLFKIPKTPESAHKSSIANIARVEASLRENIQVNQWFLRAASMGPVLSVSVSQSWGKSTSVMDGFSSGPTPSSSTTATVSIGFSINGGIGLHLKSDQMLIEEKRLESADVEDEVLRILRDKYVDYETQAEVAQANLVNLQTTLDTLLSIDLKTLTDENVGNLIGLWQSLIANIAQVESDVNQTVLIKIEILTLQGKLLDAVAK